MELSWKVSSISCNDKISSGFERALQHPIVMSIPRYRYSFSRHNECGNLSKVSDESCGPVLIQPKVVAGQNFAVFIEERSRDITAKLFRGRRIQNGCRRAFLMQGPETTTFVSKTALSILQLLLAFATVAFDLPVYFSHC